MQHDSKDPGMTGAEPAKPAPEAPANAASSQPAAGDTEPAADGSGAAGLGEAELGAGQLKQIILALQTESDKLRAELDAEKEQALRLRAEMENMRKRTEREKADMAKYAIGKFAGDVVGVADNFERALKAVPEESTVDNPTLKALHEGVSMTEREFLKMLERHGVRRLDPTGEIFNPHQHQAVMEQENPDVASGTVLQVFQPGYLIEDRVLRPAMVVVATGGHKPVKQAEAAAPPRAANDDRPGGAADTNDSGAQG